MIVVKMREILNKLTKPISDLEDVNESINQATETLSKTRSPQKKMDGDEKHGDYFFIWSRDDQKHAIDLFG